jgi:hypothetical protein
MHCAMCMCDVPQTPSPVDGIRTPVAVLAKSPSPKDGIRMGVANAIAAATTAAASSPQLHARQLTKVCDAAVCEHDDRARQTPSPKDGIRIGVVPVNAQQPPLLPSHTGKPSSIVATPMSFTAAAQRASAASSGGAQSAFSVVPGKGDGKQKRSANAPAAASTTTAPVAAPAAASSSAAATTIVSPRAATAGVAPPPHAPVVTSPRATSMPPLRIDETQTSPRFTMSPEQVRSRVCVCEVCDVVAVLQLLAMSPRLPDAM